MLKTKTVATATLATLTALVTGAYANTPAQGGEVVVSTKGGYETRTDAGKNGTAVSDVNNGDGILGAEVQYQRGKYAVGLEYLDGTNDFHTKAYNLNGYRYFQPEILKGSASPYILAGIGHLETEENRIHDSTLALTAGAGVKFLPTSLVSPKVEVRQVYGVDNRTQDTLILGAIDLNLNKVYQFINK